MRVEIIKNGRRLRNRNHESVISILCSEKYVRYSPIYKFKRSVIGKLMVSNNSEIAWQYPNHIVHNLKDISHSIMRYNIYFLI